MIRFHVKQSGQEPITTEWQDEPLIHGAGAQTAVEAVKQLRQQYPEGAIRIERKTVIPKPEHSQVRFKIVLPNNETRYSKVVNESEADALRLELLTRFPKGEVTRG